MRAVRGLVLAGGLIIGLANQASAQISLNIGNPYTGQGLSINSGGLGGYGYGTGLGYGGYNYGAAGLAPGYGYGYGYGSPGFAPGYGSGYSGYSGYSGFGPGLGYVNNYQTYSSTGFLNGPGVIGYRSGYSGINPFGGGFRRPVGSYSLGGYRPAPGGIGRVNQYRW